MRDAIDPMRFRWPTPWRPTTDDTEALALGRWIDPSVATTVLGELRREVCDRHPLAGVECRPVAREGWSKKDFLFLADGTHVRDFGRGAKVSPSPYIRCRFPPMANCSPPPMARGRW